MKHLSAAELSGIVDGVLAGRAIQAAERHLAECAACRDALAELQAQDRALGVMLVHDPGEAYFESFAERVVERLNEGQAEVGRGIGAPASETPREGGIFGWLSTPRGLALAGSVAALVLGAGIVFLTTRQDVGSLKRPEIVERTGQIAPPEAPPRTLETNRRPATTTPAPGENQPAPTVVPVPAPEAGVGEERTQVRNGAAARTEPLAAARDETKPGARKIRSTLTRSGGPERAVRVNEQGEPLPSTRFDVGRKPAPSAPGAPSRIVKPPPEPLAGTRPVASPQQADALEKAKGETLPKGKELSVRGGRPDETSMRITSERAPITLPYEHGRLCGRIVDDRGRPIAGANVAIAEFGVTATTAHDGRFCLDVAAGERTLVVMAIGFETSRRSVTVGTGTSETEVTLRAMPVLESPVRASRELLKFNASADTFASWPAAARDGARGAQRVTDRALRLRSAAEYDRAAAEWARVLERTRGGDFEIATRHHLAEAAYRSWEIAPTPQRAAAAIQALTAYIARAPLGAPREEAAKRLDRVRR